MLTTIFIYNWIDDIKDETFHFTNLKSFSSVKMNLGILNWGGTILLIIGFALMLAGIIYAETKLVLDTAFRALFFSGIALMSVGLLIIIGGHWRIFYPQTTTKEVVTTQKQVKFASGVPF